MMIQNLRDRFALQIRREKREERLKSQRTLKFTEERIAELLQCSDNQSATLLINAVGSSDEQGRLIAKLGGVPYFWALLNSKSKTKKENGIWGLANLCSHAPLECQEFQVLQFMETEVHRFETTQQLVSRIWLLSELSQKSSLDDRARVLSILQCYLNHESDAVFEECLHGLVRLVRSVPDFDANQLLKLCLSRLNRGFDPLILKLAARTIDDDQCYIDLMKEYGFLDKVGSYMSDQRICRNASYLLLHFASYYPEEIACREDICAQLRTQIKSEQEGLYCQSIVLTLLLRCNAASTLIDKLELVENVKFILRNHHSLGKAFMLVSQISHIRPGLMPQLEEELEYWSNSSNKKYSNLAQRCLQQF